MKLNFNFLLAILLTIIILWCLSTIFFAAMKRENMWINVPDSSVATTIPSVTSDQSEMAKAVALTNGTMPVASPTGSNSLFNQSSLNLSSYGGAFDANKILLNTNKQLLETNKELAELNKLEYEEILRRNKEHQHKGKHHDHKGKHHNHKGKGHDHKSKGHESGYAKSYGASSQIIKPNQRSQVHTSMNK